MDIGDFTRQAESSGYDATQIEISYPMSDPRCWTARVTGHDKSILVTYFVNRGSLRDDSFDILAEIPRLRVPSNDVFTVIAELI